MIRQMRMLRMKSIEFAPFISNLKCWRNSHRNVGFKRFRLSADFL